MSNKRKPASDEDETMEPELVDVDFDFFEFKEIDYHALGLLLRQLFSHDAVELNIPAISNFMIENKFGSTIKCDGEESDPYAFCTAVNLNTQQKNEAIASLTAYLLSKTSSSPKAKAIHDLLSNLSSEEHTGLVLNERLVNMPAQVSAPLLRILGEEAQAAASEGKDYKFSQLLYFSRIFIPNSSNDPTLEAEEDTSMAETAQPKKSKKKSKKHQSATMPAVPVANEEFFAYHPEDEVIEKFSTCTVDFTFTHSPERGEDAFGVETKGRLMLLPFDKLAELVAALEVEGAQVA